MHKPDSAQLQALLEDLAAGKRQVEEVKSEILSLSSSTGFLDIGCAKVDTDRHRRNGFAEVVFGEGKTVEQILAILSVLEKEGENLLVTRVNPEKADLLCQLQPKLSYVEGARCLLYEQKKPSCIGRVAIVSAGTADWPVAEEAATVASFFGLEVMRVNDVGVAGIHRLLHRMEEINTNDVLICVAGMEGALVSVLGGLSDKPLIAVPSGVGYGAGAGGLATLLAMLNSCASGVAVVNIGNGFGAAYMAATICRQIDLVRKGELK